MLKPITFLFSTVGFHHFSCVVDWLWRSSSESISSYRLRVSFQQSRTARTDISDTFVCSWLLFRSCRLSYRRTLGPWSSGELSGRKLCSWSRRYRRSGSGEAGRSTRRRSDRRDWVLLPPFYLTEIEKLFDNRPLRPSSWSSFVITDNEINWTGLNWFCWAGAFRRKYNLFYILF